MPKYKNKNIHISLIAFDKWSAALKSPTIAMQRFTKAVANFNETQKLLTEIKMLHPEAPIDDIWKDAVEKSKTTEHPVSYYLTLFKNGLRE